ncbi:hypothetical protein ID866_10720 [Astraeus odoratus]|nr:hypothetical protein ID866_10720 [Astraeus odoratus]
MRVWDAERGVQIGSPLQGHTDYVRSVAFSPDGTRIVLGSSDKTVRVWDAERGVQIGSPLQGHTDWVRSIAFSPDGTRIVSGSDDKTVRVCKGEGNVHIGSSLEDNPGQAMDHGMIEGNTHILEKSCDASVRQSYVEYPVLLCEDGWVRGPKGRLLVWVPHALQKPFYSLQNVLVIPSGACIELDLSKMVHGTRWQMCFNGNLPTHRNTE